MQRVANGGDMLLRQRARSGFLSPAARDGLTFQYHNCRILLAEQLGKCYSFWSQLSLPSPDAYGD
jgi:hypothetical protein